MDKASTLTVAEVAERLNVHPTTVQRWVRLGHFPGAYKKGPGRNSPYIVPETDIAAFEEKIQGRQSTTAIESEQ
jgi:excisionase family DNA binding protein